MPVKKILKREAEEMRDAVLTHRMENNGPDLASYDPFRLKQHITEWGEIDVIKASGRATCRQCGQKIAKGDKAIRFEYDFTGSGSWTLETIQIHLFECEKEVI